MNLPWWKTSSWDRKRWYNKCFNKQDLTWKNSDSNNSKWCQCNNDDGNVDACQTWRNGTCWSSSWLYRWPPTWTKTTNNTSITTTGIRCAWHFLIREKKKKFYEKNAKPNLLVEMTMRWDVELTSHERNRSRRNVLKMSRCQRLVWEVPMPLKLNTNANNVEQVFDPAYVVHHTTPRDAFFFDFVERSWIWI